MRIKRGLLISCNRNLERAVSSEMVYTLTEKLGIPKKLIKARLTGISGLTTVGLHDDLDPLDVMKKLVELEKETPYYVHTLKIKPIQIQIMADYQEMKEQIPSMVENLEGSYRVNVSKRHSDMDREMLIDAAASKITNKVDLVNYEWEFLIEIVANYMGLSVVPKGLIYSTHKARNQISKADGWDFDD